MKMVELVFSLRRVKIDRKIVSINMDFFMSGEQIQKKCFDQRELQIKDVFCHTIYL